MPIYEYECRSCGKVFSAALSLREHDAKNVVCPGCGSNKVEQLISAFIAKTDRKT